MNPTQIALAVKSAESLLNDPSRGNKAGGGGETALPQVSLVQPFCHGETKN